MAARNSGEGARPPTILVDPTSPRTGHRNSVTIADPPSPTRSGTIRRGPSASSTLSGGKGKGANASSRVIRTFEEVERVIMAEEWYEELECGVCSHVLGAPQALVPCGHTFCGPCAWEWIHNNQKFTCPHCRVELLVVMPFVPNIIVDQIIERKLKSLPAGKQREDLLAERLDKEATWKPLRSALPVKTPPVQRPRRLDGLISNLFEGPPAAASGHRRRASRNIQLGSPIDNTPQISHNNLLRNGVSLDEVRRLEPERDAVTARIEARRQAAQTSSTTSRPLPDRFTMSAGRRVTSPTFGDLVEDDTSAASPSSRLSGLRSNALAARQARGRMRGTRDHPVELDSDSSSTD